MDCRTCSNSLFCSHLLWWLWLYFSVQTRSITLSISTPWCSLRCLWWMYWDRIFSIPKDAFIILNEFYVDTSGETTVCRVFLFSVAVTNVPFNLLRFLLKMLILFRNMFYWYIAYWLSPLISSWLDDCLSLCVLNKLATCPRCTPPEWMDGWSYSLSRQIAD